MSTNIKPPEDAVVITPAHAGKALRSVANDLAITGWGPWHTAPSLLGRAIAALHYVDEDEHTVKMAGRMLGDRVMQLRPAASADDHTRPWGVTCTRGRWRWISQDDMAPIAVTELTAIDRLRSNGDGDYSLANSIKHLVTDGDPRCGHAFRVLREIGIDEPVRVSEPFAVAAIVAPLMVKADLAQRLAAEIERQHGMSHDINLSLLAECRAAGLDVRSDS